MQPVSVSIAKRDLTADLPPFLLSSGTSTEQQEDKEQEKEQEQELEIEEEQEEDQEEEREEEEEEEGEEEDNSAGDSAQRMSTTQSGKLLSFLAKIRWKVVGYTFSCTV